MELKIIETINYTLAISDKKTLSVNGDYFLDYVNNNLLHRWNMVGMHKNKALWINRVIAYQPKGNASELDLPLLPEIVVEDDVEVKSKYKESKSYKNWTKVSSFLACGLQGVEVRKIVVEDDVEKLLKNEIDYWYKETGSLTSETIIRRSFSMALKASTKVYSEEDIREAFEAGRKLTQDGFEEEDWKDYDEFIQSLKQPKTPKWFVAEKELKVTKHIPWDKELESKYDYEKGYPVSEYVLKTTTINGKTYLVGTYLYE
jgi:hypothetical protein